LVRVLSQELTTFSWSSLFPIQLRGIRNPFFWIHGQASNGVLHTYLGADQPVYGMSHQCADGKPASYKTVEAIAAHYLDEIRTVRPHGPYLLGGYCFGGIVAFEMAQQLLKQNDTTSLLVLLDPPALNNCTTGSANSRSVGIWAREALNRQLKAIRARGAVTDKARGVIKQFAGSIKKQAVRVGGKLIIKFSLMFGYLIPLTLRGPYILEVYDRALAQYFPKAYPGRVVVLKAADDHRDVQHWKELVPNALDLHIVPGNHDDVLKNPYVMSWAKKLKIYLDETSGAVPESDHAHPH
ncbi:MAG TPA: thioesterase domain-containing protein, partial [Candidatus Binatia bacterium]|jgi:thioesterase domain-containing protein